MGDLSCIWDLRLGFESKQSSNTVSRRLRGVRWTSAAPNLSEIGLQFDCKHFQTIWETLGDAISNILLFFLNETNSPHMSSPGEIL